MKRVAALCALGALLAGCKSPEDEVMEAVKKSTQVQVPASVELREVRKVGALLCGKISHEGSAGRTEFQPFFVQSGQIHVITNADYQPGKEGSRWFYEKSCLTSPSAQ